MKSMKIYVDTQAIDSLKKGNKSYELVPINTVDMLSGELREAIENYNPEELNVELTQALIVLLTKLGAFSDSENSPFLAALRPTTDIKLKKANDPDFNLLNLLKKQYDIV